MVTNISYNVIIDRLRAFADGHYLIKKFSHGQIDLRYLEQDADYYPWMHVIPGSITPSNGQREYSFDITFSDLTRDKEHESEYIREAISDCTRLAEDLLAEIKNGNTLFDSSVQSVDGSVITPFIHEDTHTLTGVTLSVSIRVPWDWSACDIPADYAPGGSGSGGGAEGGCCVTLQVEGVDNIDQSLLNLVAGSNMTITDNGDGSVTFDSTGGGGGDDLQQVTDSGNTTTNDIELIDAAVVMDNGSKLQKGTTDSGNGGLGGIALKCSIDYELKWDAGRLFVMEQDGFTIRETAHNFSNIPTTNDDDTKGYVVGSRWILDNGHVYECTDATSGAAVWVLQTLSAVTSVGLSVPSPTNPAFSVSGSPVTTSGTFSIAANGTTLEYIDGTGALKTFPNIPTTLSDLIHGTQKGDLIEYNGTTWAVIPGLNLNKLTDVNLTTPTNGQVLQYNGTTWVNVTPSFSPSGAAGGDLSGNYPNPEVHKVHGIDLQSGTPTSGDVWVYGGSPAKWQHQMLHASEVDNDSGVTGTHVDDALDHLNSTKEPTITAGTTSQYWRGDKSWHTLDKSAVGLSNVDNTSDANKPISTATQTALNAKVDTTRTISTSSPLSGGGDLSANRTLSITQATTTTDGYLSSSDFNLFSQNTTVQRLQIFGDASTAGGTTTINSSVVLSADAYYYNLTITTGGSIDLNGWRLFVQNVLDLTNAGANSIHNNGTTGAVGVGVTGGTNGASGNGGRTGKGRTVYGGLQSGSLGTTGEYLGGNGGAGGTAGTNGVVGSAPSAATSNYLRIGGAGGAGGKGGNAGFTGGNGGAAQTNATSVALTAATSVIRIPQVYSLYTVQGLVTPPTVITNHIHGGLNGGGGGGGSSSATASGVQGGCGGGGGGNTFVFAYSVTVANTTSSSAIAANGGNGGNGANSSNNNTGAGGGAGAGGGGYVVLICNTISTNGITFISANGGTGGTGGNALGTGVGGNGGFGGNGGRITVIRIKDGTVTQVDGTGGTVGTPTTATTTTGTAGSSGITTTYTS